MDFEKNLIALDKQHSQLIKVNNEIWKELYCLNQKVLVLDAKVKELELEVKKSEYKNCNRGGIL